MLDVLNNKQTRRKIQKTLESMVSYDMKLETVELNVKLATCILSILESNLTKYEIEMCKQNRTTHMAYLASLEAEAFIRKARLTYGIIDPAEALLIWLSVISGNSIQTIFHQKEISWDFSANSRWERESREDSFFKKPSEDLQLKMGGLPIVNTALLASVLELDEDLENKVKKFSGNKLENIFRDTDYKQFIIMDESYEMNYVVSGSKANRRGISYTAQILLDAIKKENEIFVGFSSLGTNERIMIKTDKDVYRFWMRFGTERFNEDGNTTIPYIIGDFLGLPEYQLVAGNKTCLTIITCDYGDLMYPFQTISVRDLNIKLNLIVLAPTNKFRHILDLKRINADVTIFSLEDGFLVETTEEFRRV